MNDIQIYQVLIVILEKIAANTPPQDLAVTSDAFISTPGTPTTVHVIILIDYYYGWT